MMRLRPRPIGLIGQIVAILLMAVAAEFVASTLLYERASEFSIGDDEARRLGEHLVVARRLLDKAPPARRPGIALALSTGHYAIGWAIVPPLRPTGTLNLTRRQIIAWEPGLAATDLRLSRRVDGLATRIDGGMMLADGSWLSFQTHHPLGGQDWWRGRIATAALIALLVVIFAGLLVRRTLAPLRRLAHAADRFGTVAPEELGESGPTEIRQVIAAFNRMQARIQRLIAERTQALAAVGHDLRTPLARLRLRVDGVTDADLRATVGDDIAEMEAMVTSLLAYLGGEGDPESRKLADIAVICATLADDACDHGQMVDYCGPDHCELAVRRVSIKRALSNLLENALHFGTTIRIILEIEPDHVSIAFEDNGPGVPPEALQSVVEPFVRLDTARRRDTVGLGLGLAIVSRVVAVEGGTLNLSNRPEGGLRAEIRLPRVPPP